MESSAVAPAQRWRLVVRRTPEARPLQQSAWLRAWEDALLQTGLPLAAVGHGSTRPRIAAAATLPAGLAADRELLDVFLTQRLPRSRVREALSSVFPAGHDLVDLYDVWLGEPALPGQVVGAVYRATLPGVTGRPDRLRTAARAMLGSATLRRERRKGDRVVAYDLRPFIADLAVEEDTAAGTITIRAHLRHDPERGVGRPEEVLAELERHGGSPLGEVTLVRERLVLASDTTIDS